MEQPAADLDHRRRDVQVRGFSYVSIVAVAPTPELSPLGILQAHRSQKRAGVCKAAERSAAACNSFPRLGLCAQAHDAHDLDRTVRKYLCSLKLREQNRTRKATEFTKYVTLRYDSFGVFRVVHTRQFVLADMLECSLNLHHNRSKLVCVSVSRLLVACGRKVSADLAFGGCRLPSGRECCRDLSALVLRGLGDRRADSPSIQTPFLV